MALTDQRKLELWAQRVGQHRASGLSVIKYCQREKLAVHDFYYWRRKLGGPGQRASSVDSRKQAPPAAGPFLSSSQAGGDGVAAMVQVQLGGRACVSVPAHMLDAIRTVLQTVLSCDTGSQASSSSGAFQPVIVRT